MGFLDGLMMDFFKKIIELFSSSKYMGMIFEGLKTTFSNIFGFWFYTEEHNFEYVWVGKGGLSDNDVSVV